jgi:predicted TIM-barrel fold metal-dependent hydrolase
VTRIIDIHTHPIFFEDNISEKQIDALVRYSRKLGIVKMVSLGDVLRYGPKPVAKHLKIINDESHALVKRHPDFFIAFCYLNPLLGEKAVRAEVDRCVGELGFRGIKLEIANNASHAAMKAVMKVAEEFNVPVLQHTWATQHSRLRLTHSDSIDTCALARRHPNTRVIMAHLPGIGHRGVLEAIGIDNLVVDTSACLPFAGLVEFAYEKLGATRVLYGSDLPIRELSSCIARVTSAPIPEAAKTRILYDNAARELGLATED